jgi:hypothetical protein
MTKETIFKFFLNDPLLIEKDYLTEEQRDSLKFIDVSEVKLLQVIKMAIIADVAGESVSVISRKINQYLNK